MRSPLVSRDTLNAYYYGKEQVRWKILENITNVPRVLNLTVEGNEFILFYVFDYNKTTINEIQTRESYQRYMM